MPKTKKDKTSNNLKEELKKEEVKERFTNLAFDLFDKGAGNDIVLREISIFVPNMSLDLVQRLRGQWSSKREVDMEIAGVGDGVPPPKKVEERIEPPNKIERDDPSNKIKEEIPEKPPEDEGKVEHEAPNKIVSDPNKIVDEPEVAPSVKTELGAKSLEEPSVDEESLRLNAVEEDALHDDEFTDDEKKQIDRSLKDAKEGRVTPLKAEGEDISRAPSRSLRDEVEAERGRVEVVRATEELRRAITSEIRAQESYEQARLEMESAKQELDVVRGELDGFRRDVDLLKKQKRVVEREPEPHPVLESATEAGKQFEEEVSRGPVKRFFEDMIHMKVEEEFEKRREGTSKLPPVEVPDEGDTLEEKPVGKALEKPDDFVMEKVAEMLGVGVDEAHQWIANNKKGIETESKKRAEDIPKLEPILDEKPVEKPEASEAKAFYDRIIRYLSEYPYVVVRLADGKPVVYRLKLRLVGILIGLGIGVPVGCLVLYIILLSAGML